MELPSMVQRSGDTLIVRSVVSGNQLYLDQGAASTNNNNNSNKHSSPSPLQQQQSIGTTNLSNSALEQLERYRAAAAQYHLQQQQQQQHQNATQQQQSAAVAAATASAVAQQQAMELKDEGLPQCKIKRNYSCSYCTYFTQNPRYHLTHLRDVHGEKIVINKCKLCLYASRHFQKLVRHMKMVHGCTDGVAGGHGQPRGKRGMSREARKRKLEQSVGLGGAQGEISGGGGGGNVGMGDGVSKMPTYEQVKRELELQRESLFAVVYERELQAQRERDLEARHQAQNVYEQEIQAATAAAAAAAASETQRHQSPINATSSNNASASSNSAGTTSSQTAFQLPPAHQQPLTTHTRNVELSPSPTDSVSSAHGAEAATTAALHSSGVSLTYVGDEPTQNRLLKCSLCDFTTLFRAQLVDHELDEHCKTKFFRCEKCSYVTHIKARFSKHVKYHSMPMIKCVTCDFRTPYKWNLDRHMKNHGGAGPFKCAACDFTADIKQSLTVHEMNHHVPPVGHAAGMSLARRRNKVGGTDLCEDFLSDSADLLEDHFNNNNLDEYDEALMTAEPYSKRGKYDDDEPTDLSAKGGSSDTSSVHNHSVNVSQTPKAKRPIPNLIPIPKNTVPSIMNLSKEFAASRSSLTDIASMFFNDKQISEMLQPLEKADAAQLSPTPTVASTSSHASRSLLQKKPTPGGSFFDKLKSSALAGPSENLICPCGHMAKCLSESIIHRKTCNFAAIAEDDVEEEQDDADDRLEIDFAEDDDRQSHSALNLSVTGSTRCQHCRHRCKSSADLLNHLKQCTEASRCGNDSYDSLSGESNAGRAGGADSTNDQHPMENRVFIWNKMPGGEAGQREGSQCSEIRGQTNNTAESSGSSGNGASSATCEENSYYGVETAPGYGEVTKKMTPEEEAANSSLKKVYKCPHCSFWASTASRFHVHIVGHLNKKPFECSLCSYRSNWRWDITKHIRLKTIRDPSHKNARVLMNDETGRRNYTKYNKYITLMKVTEEDGDPKLMKSGEMTPNQVASLSFINDFNKNVGSNALTSTHLNGIKEDITLEPIPSKSNGGNNGGSSNSGGDQLSDGFIRLPLLATMMNAAMAQQHHQQKDQEHGQAAMITPSVTISAVKRSPPPLMKPSDDLVTDVRQEGNEKKTFYRCRKCSFRHSNRDAVLAHVKIHYQDTNYPIVTATATTSPKSANSQQQQNTPLQVAVNPNIYMNKVLAAMCLSQQQPQQPNSNSSINNNDPQQQQHSIISAGLLQQAIQGAPPNSPLSCLALTLAGKSPAKATASILEHGEQKATQNEASAKRPTSPKQNSNNNNNSSITLTNLATSSSTSSSPNSSGGSNVCGVGLVGSATSASSLQHLLTSPRGIYTSSAHTLRNQLHSPTISTNSNNNNNNGGSFGVGGHTNNNNSNTNLVKGALTVTKHSSATTPLHGTIDGAFGSPTSAVSSVTAAEAIGTSSLHSSPRADAAPNTPSVITVTTLPTTPTSSTTASAGTKCASNPYHIQMGLIGASSISNNHSGAIAYIGGGGGSGGGIVGTHSDNNNSLCIGGLMFGSNNSTTTTTSLNRNTSIPTTTATTIASSGTTAGNSGGASSSSCNLLLSSTQSATAAAATATAASALYASNVITLSPPSASSCISANATTSNFSNTQNPNQSQSNNCSNLLVNDSERREPSPYRCGHCHQVSNWKHVIQRHCRLKHAGDIRIETLDRTASANERHAPPIYRPLGNGASNESNYGLTLKVLQQQQHQQQQQQHQQQQQQPPHINSIAGGPPSHSVLMSNNKNEQHLLHSPLAGTAAANAATTPQELQQAAAAYIAATYKAAAAAAANSTGNGSAAAAVAAAAALGLSSEDLLLHQQLQQNDQIEITRLPPGVSNAAQSHTQAQVQPQPQQQQQLQQQQLNSKCKQQKCPLCPYISESKSQMNYHISLHKPTQYECSLCTFVCAKKQHLSSHMRTVHQQHNLSASSQLSNMSAAINSMDFSMALQLAAVAQAQQDQSSLSSPLAIDLTALKQKISAVQHQQQQQNQKQLHQQCQTQQTSAQNAQQQQQHPHQHPPTATESQMKCILYCPKCPARYIQKYNDTWNAKAELEDHIKCHNASDVLDNATNAPQTPPPQPAFKCEFCDYDAVHDAQLQKHRYVHTQHYQDKCAELYKHVQEDLQYAPPKLMEITLAKSLQQAPETIWIVDNELNDQCKDQQQQQQQHASISSSSVTPAKMTASTATGSAHFDNANSLLKKQLESGIGSNSGALRSSPTSTPTPKELADADDSSNMPSTSASVATSDLAVDGGSDFTSSVASPAPVEKCLYCPYETKHTTLYKAHLQHHICISNQKEAYTCEHCDYTDSKQEHIEEHTRVHFNAVEKLKSVAFFTSYDNLELSVERDEADDDKDIENELHKEERTRQSGYRTKSATDTEEQEMPNARAALQLNIKEEHNNNNEEHVVNENVVKEQQQQLASASKSNNSKAKVESDEKVVEKSTVATAENIKKPCNKIILYKTDGCLSIKRESGGGNSNASNCENISDRLRRRISRNNSNTANHLNSVGGSGNTNNNNNNSHNSNTDEQADNGTQQQQSHKTILVNAKTGQVISRN